MSNVFDINVEDTAPVGAVYGRMPAQKRRSVQKTPKTPTTLSDLGSEVAGALPPTTRSKSKKATLSKISEAAEWADASARELDSINLDDEFESLWAEAGFNGGSTETPVKGDAQTSASVSSVIASATARKVPTSPWLPATTEPAKSSGTGGLGIVEMHNKSSTATHEIPLADESQDAASPHRAVMLEAVTDSSESEDEDEDEVPSKTYIRPVEVSPSTPITVDALSTSTEDRYEQQTSIPANTSGMPLPTARLDAHSSEDEAETKDHLILEPAPGRVELDQVDFLFEAEDFGVNAEQDSDDDSDKGSDEFIDHTELLPAAKEPAPQTKPSTANSWSALPLTSRKDEIWNCWSCKLDNTASSDFCAECGAPRQPPSSASRGHSPERAGLVSPNRASEQPAPLDSAELEPEELQHDQRKQQGKLQEQQHKKEQEELQEELQAKQQEKPQEKLQEKLEEKLQEKKQQQQQPEPHKEELAQKQSALDLIAIMDSAVASVEATAIDEDDDDDDAPVLPQKKEPEVAGREEEVEKIEKTRFASGSVAMLLAKSEKDGVLKKPLGGRFVSRADAFEEAMKKGTNKSGTSAPSQPSKSPTFVPPAAAVSAPAAQLGLKGLRKAYGATGVRDGTAAPSADAGKAWGDDAKAEEEKEGKECKDNISGKHESPADPGETEAAAEAALEAEWAEVEARTDELRAKVKATEGKICAEDDVLSKPITWNEVNTWVRRVDIDEDVLKPFRAEQVEDGGCGCFARRRSASEIPRLDKRCYREKDLMLVLKVTKFEFNELAHFRMLRTMYIKLTRNKVCSSIGKHWEVIGFQAGDPRTDLNRSGGILNVLHMFYFFSHFFDIMKDVHQNFPLACVSINITRMVMESFLAGRLSALCNANEKGVFDTLCGIYAGGFHHFYYRWRTQKRTIRDTELTFNEVKELMQNKPSHLLLSLAKGAAEMKAKTDPSRLEFTDMAFGSARRPQAAAEEVPSRLRNYQDTDGAD